MDSNPGRPKLAEGAVRRHTFGVRLTDAEAERVRRAADQMDERPTTAIRTLVLAHFDASDPTSSEPQPADIRIEIRRVGHTLARIEQRLRNRRIARRPDTQRILEALQETAVIVAKAVAK